MHTAVTADEIRFDCLTLQRVPRKLLGPQAIPTITGRGYRFKMLLDESAAHQASAARRQRLDAEGHYGVGDAVLARCEALVLATSRER